MSINLYLRLYLTQTLHSFWTEKILSEYLPSHLIFLRRTNPNKPPFQKSSLDKRSMEPRLHKWAVIKLFSSTL